MIIDHAADDRVKYGGKWNTKYKNDRENDGG
jgi:hypothetical protein